MGIELEILARRAVASKHWRWIEGMLTERGDRIASVEHDSLIVLDEEFEIVELTDGKSIPDLRDPATLGCLLILVREAHNAPHAWVEARHGQRFRVVSPEGYSEATRMLCEWQVGTEAAALVAALENAP